MFTPNSKLFALRQRIDHLGIEPLLRINESEWKQRLGDAWTEAVAETSRDIATRGLEAICEEMGSTGQAILAMCDPAFLDHSTGSRQQFSAELVVVGRCEIAAKAPCQLLWTRDGSSLLERECPELAALVDDEGLIHITSPSQCSIDGFSQGISRVPPHRLLPTRGNSDPSQDCLAALLVLAETNPRCQVRIAPDYNRILPAHRPRVLYEDHARGRPWNRSDLDDVHRVGLTVHTAPSLDSKSSVACCCALQGLIRIEALWTSKDRLKTLQLEEIKDHGSPGLFAHAIRDTSRQHFLHLDGAAMLYSQEIAALRRSPNTLLPKTPKALKPKLFRIDGELSTDEFSDICHLFFRSNPLVAEYFAGHIGDSVSFYKSEH